MLNQMTEDKSCGAVSPISQELSQERNTEDILHDFLADFRREMRRENDSDRNPFQEFEVNNEDLKLEVQRSLLQGDYLRATKYCMFLHIGTVAKTGKISVSGGNKI